MTPELHQALRRTDREAQRRLLQRWSATIRRWCLVMLGDPVLADDAAQESALRLLDRVAAYDPARPFEPWLRTLVRHVCVDHQRRAARRREDQPVDRAARPTTERALDLRRSTSHVFDALEQLSEGQRAVWIAVELEGRSAAELAAELGIAPSTARVQLHKARRALRVAVLAADPSIAHLLEDL